MKKIHLLVYVMSFFLLLSSCASMDKAEALNREGKRDQALEMAISYLDDSEQNVRLRAIQLVGQIGGDQAGKELLQRLLDPSLTIQIAIVKALGNAKYAEASGALVDLVPDAKGELSEEIAKTIRKIGEPANQRLVQRFQRAPNDEKTAYRQMCIDVGPEVTPVLVATLKGQSAFQNRYNYEVLVALKNPRVAGLMIVSIDDEEVGELIKEGLIKLGRLSTNAVIKELKNRQMDTENQEGKIRLIQVLGETNAQSAIPLLEALANTDLNENVKAEANHALRGVRGF